MKSSKEGNIVVVVLVFVLVSMLGLYIVTAIQRRRRVDSGESSFVPSSPPPIRGVFAPIPTPPAGGAPPPPPAPPVPPPPGPPAPPSPDHGHGHHHPHHGPYPYYPYGYWQDPAIFLIDPPASSCYKWVKTGENSRQSICLSRKQYVVYLRGRLMHWRDMLKDASNKRQTNRASKITEKINTIIHLLQTEGVTP